MKTPRQKRKAFIIKVKKMRKTADKNFFDKILQRAIFASR